MSEEHQETMNTSSQATKTAHLIASGNRSVSGSKVTLTQNSTNEDQSRERANTGPAGTSSTAASTTNTSSDEELRRAEKMALAIASNPNLTPDEIRQLCGADAQQTKFVQQAVVHQQQQQHRQWSLANVLQVPHHSHQHQHDTHAGGGAPAPSVHNPMKQFQDSFRATQESFRATTEKAREKLQHPFVVKKTATASQHHPQQQEQHSTAPAVIQNPITRQMQKQASTKEAQKHQPATTKAVIQKQPSHSADELSTAATPSEPSTTTNARDLSAGSLPDEPSFEEIQSNRPTSSKPVITPAVSTKTLTSPVAPMQSSESKLPEPVSPKRSPMWTPKRTISIRHPISPKPLSVPNLTTADESPVLLSATLWKRRSGFGKLSVKHAWEKRRVVLQEGGKLLYYKTSSEEGAEDDDEQLNEDSGGGSGSNLMPATTSAAGGAGAKSRTGGWLWEQARELNHLIMDAGGDPNDPNAPRGMLDLVKEHATVSATTGHSGAPTPFCLSIKVKSETKWKLAYQSHRVQMEWLAAMTDVVVASSIEGWTEEQSGPAGTTLNAFIFTAPSMPMDFSSSGGGGSGGGGGGANSTRDLGGTLGKSSSERVIKSDWKMENYKIKSSRIVGETQEDEEEKEKEGEEEEENVEEEETLTKKPSEQKNVTFSRTITGFTEPAEDEDVPDFDVTPPNVEPASMGIMDDLALKGSPLWNVAVILNAALFYSHSSSTSIDQFWYMITFINLFFWICLERGNKKSKGQKSGSSSGLDAGSTTVTSITSIESSRTEVSSEGGKASIKKVAAKVTKRTTKRGKVEEFKPVAGTTTIQIDQPTDPPMFNNKRYVGWRQVRGSQLSVRSVGYLSTKVKVPSAGELYECSYCDVFESGSRYPDMSSKVKLPKPQFDDGEGFVKTWRSPDVFVISVSIPTEAPKIGRNSDDGRGYTITMYYTMKQATRDILKRVTHPDYDSAQEPTPPDVQKSMVNAVKLFEEWCRRAPTDPKFQARFKFIANAHNLTEVGMPGWIAKYNMKPVLIKRSGQTGFLYSHPELSCMEFDVSFFPFPYLAKQAISYMKDRIFKEVYVSFGFCIEGRSDEELPEALIGIMQLCYPDPAIAIQGEDFFAGKSPPSFIGKQQQKSED